MVTWRFPGHNVSSAATAAFMSFQWRQMKSSRCSRMLSAVLPTLLSTNEPRGRGRTMVGRSGSNNPSVRGAAILATMALLAGITVGCGEDESLGVGGSAAGGTAGAGGHGGGTGGSEALGDNPASPDEPADDLGAAGCAR